MTAGELIVFPGQLFPGVAQVLAAEASLRRGLYRRSERTWLVINSAEARDLASVAEGDMCERLASAGSASGRSSTLHGAVRLAAILAYESACSLPATLLWAGTQRIVTSLSRMRTRSQTSIVAMAKR